MAYTLLLQTSDTDCLLHGTIKIDRTKPGYVGTVQTKDGKDELSLIEIEIGERLKFTKRNAAGELVSYTFRPDPETPEFPESMRHCLTWWIGESYDGKRVGNARCVLSLAPSAMSEPPPPPPRPFIRSAALDPMPHAVSLQ